MVRRLLLSPSADSDKSPLERIRQIKRLPAYVNALHAKSPEGSLIHAPNKPDLNPCITTYHKPQRMVTEAGVSYGDPAFTIAPNPAYERAIQANRDKKGQNPS